MGLIINASNVHSGGGLSLLVPVLRSLDRNFEGRVMLDERVVLPKDLPANIFVRRIQPSLVGRLAGEWCLRRWVKTNDTVLCFGNLPPIFSLRGKVFVFVQNRYLVDRRNLKGFPFLVRMRILLERLWFAIGKRRVSKFIVQTPSMQRAIQEHLGEPSEVLPFWGNPQGYARVGRTPRAIGNALHDFLYVASGEPHKNHQYLIDAWILLAAEGLRPSLCLTIDKSRFPDLWTLIEKVKSSHDLKISNIGVLPHKEVESLYKVARALIYPSSFETLGLPLIEARCAGLPILAPEVDYVRDVIDPEQTFDSESPVSIARAVKRFLGIPEVRLPLTDAGAFISRICNIDLT